MSDMLSMLWVEKYRPKTLEDVSLPNGYKEKFEEFIEHKEIPHLLLHGPQGSGKTTIARILCENICSDKRNVLVLNGSSKEHRSLHNVTMIEAFCQSPPWGDDKIKIVFIDEADNLTSDAFMSLRGVFEKYVENARFLWTCNYKHKMPDPILSRLSQYEFSQFDQDFVIVICEDILNSEQVEYDTKDIEKIVDLLFPDVRGIVNTLQKLTIKNKLIVDSLDNIASVEKKIIDCIIDLITAIKNNDRPVINNTVNAINEMVVNVGHINYLKLYESIFANPNISWPIKMLCNKYSLNYNNALSQEMHFMAFIYESISFANDMMNTMRG